MTLNEANYYGGEASRQYMSVSQFKNFMKCEAAAKAELDGSYIAERGRALLLGSYVDEALTGTKESFEKFCEDNKAELFQKRGDKKYADVVQADEAIRRVREQPLMMKYLSGGHQTIMTGEIEGVPVKGKFDSYMPGEFIADLKYLKDFRSPNLFENAISYYKYDMQLAVYRELVKQSTGQTLPCYLVVVTKQTPPDVAVVEVASYDLDAALYDFTRYVRRFQAIKDGKVEAERCESHDCPWCRMSKVLTEPIDSSLLGKSKRDVDAMNGII